MIMRRPIIAILTDFGTSDHYVASMKGVVLGVCPDATVVDISHDVAPHDVLAGALLIESCWRDFPPGTVVLGVVDPGVGSSRRALAAEGGGLRFVGPDNGLFSLVWRDTPDLRVVEVADCRRARADSGRTFEGRDRFAPAAARLANGVALETLGPPVEQTIRLSLPTARIGRLRMDGEIIAIDRFGNLVTNLGGDQIGRWAGTAGVRVSLGRRRIGEVVGTYADVAPGAACAIIGSTGRLEIAVREGNAERLLRVRRGGRVAVERVGRRRTQGR